MDAQNTATPAMFDINAAERFANLALACVHKEYPNKISHSLNSDADVAPPRKLTPAFYGCYDWHSSVHGHWLLVRLIRTFPEATFAPSAREALRQSLTADNITQEAVYLRAEGRASFERPYGLAWLLQLVAELREWDDPQARDYGCELASAGTGRAGTAEGLASQALLSGANRGTFADRLRSRPDAGLCTRHWRYEGCRAGGIESSAVLSRGQELSAGV